MSPLPRAVLALLLITMPARLLAQGALTQLPAFDDVARRYVAQALDSNLGLKGEDLELSSSALALQAARVRFYPELSFEARYTRADGGRVINFPVGQLLNPVYQTLNQMLAAQGQTPRFGTVSDQNFAFQRPREQDSHVSLRQGIYEPAVPAAIAAQRAYLTSREYARVVLARQLRRDVIVGYAGYLKSLRSETIVRAAESTLAENLRVTESLYANGRVTQDQVLRARAEQMASVQQLKEAQDGSRQAQRYVNFLLNRELDAPLEDARASDDADAVPFARDPKRQRDAALAQRAELGQADALARAAEAQVGVARAALKPQLGLGVDAGTQGEQYRLGTGYNYITASLVLTWKFFDGGANRAAAAQASLAARRLDLERQELAQRVSLEVEQASDRLDSALSLLATAKAREAAAEAALRIASRKRDEGALSQLEFIDARTTLTSAQLNYNVTRYDIYARRAELDFATGSGDLPRAGAQGNPP
jgi:outer membrane protein TolC